jgi:hypothetical protein
MSDPEPISLLLIDLFPGKIGVRPEDVIFQGARVRVRGAV